MAEQESSPAVAEDYEVSRQIVAAASDSPANPRKPRGRPPGSKNKPKPPLVIERESESAMRPVVLEFASGSDVILSLSNFARRRRLGVSVINGSGVVTNVTLRHPSALPSSLSLHGRFDLLSLSGTLLPANLSSSVVKSPFTVSLAGPQGQVIGGALTGSLTAAGSVLLMVATFGSPEFCRLPGEEEEEADSEARAHVAGPGEATPEGASASPWTGSQVRHSNQRF